jgi:hypothetical protein
MLLNPPIFSPFFAEECLVWQYLSKEKWYMPISVAVCCSRFVWFPASVLSLSKSEHGLLGYHGFPQRGGPFVHCEDVREHVHRGSRAYSILYDTLLGDTETRRHGESIKLCASLSPNEWRQSGGYTNIFHFCNPQNNSILALILLK